MMAGLSQLSQMCALKSFSSWIQWKWHWVLNPLQSILPGANHEICNKRLLSLQPCSPFIKWLIRVRTEDANCKQPTETVCYTHWRNVKFTTNTKKLAESTCKTSFLASLRELGDWATRSTFQEGGSWMAPIIGPCVSLIKCWLSALPRPLQYPRSLLWHLALIFIRPFSGSYVLVWNRHTAQSFSSWI